MWKIYSIYVVVLSWLLHSQPNRLVEVKGDLYMSISWCLVNHNTTHALNTSKCRQRSTGWLQRFLKRQATQFWNLNILMERISSFKRGDRVSWSPVRQLKGTSNIEFNLLTPPTEKCKDRGKTAGRLSALCTSPRPKCDYIPNSWYAMPGKCSQPRKKKQRFRFDSNLTNPEQSSDKQQSSSSKDRSSVWHRY